MPAVRSHDSTAYEYFPSESDEAQSARAADEVSGIIPGPLVLPQQINDVRVDLVVIDIMKIKNGPRAESDGLLLQLRISHYDQSWMWQTFENRLQAFAEGIENE